MLSLPHGPSTSPLEVGPLFNWRDHLPVHPLADAYPKVPHERLVAIGETIRQRGLQFPIVIHAKGDHFNTDTFELLDGITRLDAMTAVGLKFKFERFRFALGYGRKKGHSLRLVIDGFDDPDDPQTTKLVENLSEEEIAAYIETANVHRRHLEPEQYHARIEASRARIEAALKRNPERSDRAHAGELGVSDKTIAKVRKSTAEGSAVDGKRVGKDGRARKQPRTRSKTRSINRSKKLGEELVASLQGTSLGTAKEQDELLVLNRGAESGELTDDVRRLVEDAKAGKAVSAIAYAAELTGKPKTPGATETPSDRLRHFADALADYASSPPKSKKPSLVEIWESTPEERQLIADRVLEQFFAAAEGADILEHIPADRRTEVVRAILDQLGVDGMRAAMSPEFGQQLRAAVPKHKPDTSNKPGKKFKTMRMEPTGTDASGNPVFAQVRGNRSQH
jgi:hypothetical protein